VVAVGDVKGAFELVNRLVQDGQDLRNVTSEALAHFRNLLLAKTAPGQDDLLDVAADAYETLRVQAERYTPGELARVISLLLAAQNDMRWTTSPRLSLELALVRACLPDTDPSPAALTARLERLERLANVQPGAVVPAANEAPAAPPSPADDVVVVEAVEPPVVVDAPASVVAEAPASVEAPAPGDASAEAAADEPAEPVGASATADAEPVTAPGAPAFAGPSAGAETQMPVPHAADAAGVDVAMLRRSWPALLDHLGQMRQPVLRAFLESATPASFDGLALELAFPPDKRFGVQKVEDRQDVLRQALTDLFGISPTIACVVRESRDPVGGPASVEVVEEDEVPDEAEALRRVQEMLGAGPSGDGGAE
ncbi:MAG TPA: hypothetical protein VF044_09820, partial [Actinomycetota bacterium]